MKEKNRLQRWSEKKLHRRKQSPDPEPSPIDKDMKSRESQAAENQTETIPEDLKTLDLENLSPDFDYRRAFDTDVPTFLRRRILRQMWLKDPALNALDGMNDYDEDYRDAAVGVAAMRGMFEKTIATLNNSQQDLLKESHLSEGKQNSKTPLNKEAPLTAGEAKIETDTPEPPKQFRPKEWRQKNSPASERTDEISDKNSNPVANHLTLLSKHGWLP